MNTIIRKPSCCLGFKNQGIKLAKTRNLGFHRNDCAYGGGESKKPAKNQGLIQGSRKPSVYFLIYAPKRTVLLTTSRRKESLQKISNLFG
jgi:hypothetical protein